jgi:hypothetical protein
MSMKKICILSILSIGFLGSVHAFTNLQDLQTYSAQHPEYPDGDTNQWLDQTYTTVYQSMEPGLFTRVGRWLHLSPQPLWSAVELEKMLERVVRAPDRTKQYETVLGTLVTEPMRFVVLSGLHGAFHSLVRILTDLQSQGTLDSNLMLADKTTTLVFNGDVIAGSPYVLETLTVILLLIERNPGKVWYLQGKDELDQAWRSRELGRQLVARCGTHCYKDIEALLALYFQALPQAWYIVDSERKNAFVFDSFDVLHRQRDAELGSFFTNLQPNSITTYSFFERLKTEQSVTIKALVQSRTTWPTIKPIMPCELLSNTKPLTWLLTSAQTRAYRQLYRFFYDAYAVITVTPKLEKSTLRCRAHDVRKEQPFEQQACYDLLSGTECPKK